MVNKSTAINDEKLKVIMRLFDDKAELGIIAVVLVPFTVNEAEVKFKDIKVEGKVIVIYPLALNLEFTLYVII